MKRNKKLLVLTAFLLITIQTTILSNSDIRITSANLLDMSMLNKAFAQEPEITIPEDYLKVDCYDVYDYDSQGNLTVIRHQVDCSGKGPIKCKCHCAL